MSGSNPGPVVFCYDGSDGARHALEAGGELFADRPAAVVSVWVSIWDSVSAVAYAALPQYAADEADKASQARAGELAAEGAVIVGPSAEARPAKARGTVWETVLQVADSLNASAIVVGSRGLGAFRSQMLGSVSHGLTHHAQRPVVVVPRVG